MFLVLTGSSFGRVRPEDVGNASFGCNDYRYLGALFIIFVLVDMDFLVIAFMQRLLKASKV